MSRHMNPLAKALSPLLSMLLATPAMAAPAPSRGRAIDESQRVVLTHSVHPAVAGARVIGSTALDHPMDKMILSLALRPGAQERLERLLAEQQDPASANYHRWLTPEEFGREFGPSEEDLDTVIGWLQGQGFGIDEVAAGRTWIDFSGDVALVERAFQTSIKDLEIDGQLRHANSVDPSIPRALAPLVNGIVSLHDIPRRAMNRGFVPVQLPEEGRAPLYTSSTGAHYMAPADFAKIYNVNAVYTAGIDGTGQTVAVVGRTEIALADVQYFRSYFGLPAKDPVFVNNGTSPGDLGGGEEGEADLDVEWSGAVAKNATIKFVISKSTTTTDGVDLSAQYIVNNNVAPVMTTSFGQCESSMGTTENTFYNNLWSQAATQGITAFVSSGDSGASGCDGGTATTGTGRAVSGLCSTPYNVCVGGTQFNDTASPSTYWSSTTSTTDRSSVLGYIPEMAWNESGNVTGGSGLWATGGGVSTVYAKPSWQVAPGVPADGKRDVPDVALSAAGHDGYLTVQGHTSTASGLAATGGTSASSPSFAGLMALVNQKTATTQGNANTRFYQLGQAQYGSAGAAVFHDTTSGNNSVPGVTGFTCGTGYDAATGLGTVDANALVNNWATVAPTPDFAISASPAAVSAVQGASATVTVSTTVSGGFNSAVSLSASGLPTGASATFNPTSIAAPGSGSSTLTLAAGTAAAGTYSVTVTGTGSTKTHSATVSFTVTAPGGTYPESAHPYANNTDLTWTYTLAGSPASINVTFDAQTKVESGYDYIYVMDKNGVNITGSPFTSTTLASATKNVPGDTVKIRLTSDSSVTYWGFRVTNVTAGGGTADTTPPTTSVTSPANGATVSGTVNVTATASDNVGVTKMEIYVDGALKTSNTAATSLTYSWATTGVANGSHTLQSKAYDAAGNVGSSAVVTVTVSNSTTSQQLLGNPGFENGSTAPAPWTVSSGVIDNSTGEAAHSGSWKAWMCGYGSTHTDTLLQQVTVPSTATTATLSFWLHIDTAETGTTAYDTLKVQIRNSSGTVLTTLATYSNVNAAAGYTQKSFNAIAYKGQTIQVYLVGSEDSSLQTSFVVDDFALNVQ